MVKRSSGLDARDSLFGLSIAGSAKLASRGEKILKAKHTGRGRDFGIHEDDLFDSADRMADTLQFLEDARVLDENEARVGVCKNVGDFGSR